MKRIAILFSGLGSNFAYLAEHLHKKELEIVIAITNNPNAKGIEVAKKYDIPIEVIDSKSYSGREEFDAAIVNTLQKFTVELTVLAGFMRILTPVFTKQIRAVNLHPSLLPRHRGLDAIRKSYDDEFEMGGVTVHYVNQNLDSGEMILQKSIYKNKSTFEQYENKIKFIEKEALAEAIVSTLK